MSIFENSATSKRTQKNIEKTLKYSLKKEGVGFFARRKAVNEILRTHGLHKEDFDVTTNFYRLTENKLNDVSIDDNSNKNEVIVNGLLNEASKNSDKLIGYDLLYRQMKQDWGKKEAKYLSGLMYDYSLYLHDSSKVPLPYCFAVDFSKLVIEGRPFGQLQSKPPKRVDSYVSALVETIHQMSNHLAGAIAVSTLFTDIAYILLEREKIGFTKFQQSPKLKKYVENALQSFVHSVNHMSRSGNETPFTNVSVFDRPKLRAILGEDNLGWMFQDWDIEEVVEYVWEIQKIFMEFFDLGDQLGGGKPIRFPVVTLNVSKDENNSVGDEKALEYYTNLDIHRYNIFSSEGTKTASCCRLVNDAELMELGGQTNSFGGSAISLGSHRVVTLNLQRLALKANSFQEFRMELNKVIESSTRILKSHKTLLQVLVDKGYHPFVSMGWIKMDRLFSTYGIAGIVEATNTIKSKWGVQGDVTALILSQINAAVKPMSSKYGLIINIEQVPMESAAPKLAKIDKMLYKDYTDYQLYANQFVPLWEDATLFERMDVDGKYNALITGGGIVHFSLAENTTPKQNKMLIEYAIKHNAEHFALNGIYSECVGGHTVFGNVEKCPVCGEPISEKYQRVVGFFTPISSWNKVRRDWEFPRRVSKKVEGVV